MEERPSAENADRDGLANSITDQTTNETRPDEANSPDSADKNQPAEKKSEDKADSSESNGKPSNTTVGDSAMGNTSAKSASTDEPVTTTTKESASDPQPKEQVSGGSSKNPAAVFLGRLGGLKGGKARAKTLTKSQRIEAARKAALARWRKKKKN